MRSASVLSLVFLIFTYVHAQWNSLGNSFTPIPPGTFQGGIFDPNSGKQLQQQIQQQIQNSMQQLGMGNGNNNAVISTENGQTVVKATIGGKSYTATFPGTDLSIFTSSGTYTLSGKTVDVFTITVNNQTYVYNTSDGKTTVTNGSGQPVSDGGPFHVTSR
ncbi:hypothetical protein V3C99_010123 [Haemonchus contortus]